MVMIILVMMVMAGLVTYGLSREKEPNFGLRACISIEGVECI